MLNDGDPQSRNRPTPGDRNAMGRIHKVLFAFSLIFVFLAAIAQGQTTAFTFQGQLKDNGVPASGNYDIQVKLYDTPAPGTGTQIGATITFSAAPVTNGMFTVQPDFTANAFPGFDRFIEVGVKPAGSNSAFNILSPRQPITPTPYAIRSESASTADSATNATNTTNASHATNADNATNADSATNATHATNADNATNASTATNANHATNSDNATNANNAATATNSTQLGGQPATSYVQTSDARLSDARPPTVGSTNYIQNTTTQEAANFNISGNGIVGGNVGIGTTTPQSKLSVQASGYGFTQTDGTVTVGSYVNPSGGWLGTRSNHPLYFFTNDSGAQMTLNTAGSFGIGTTTPDSRAKLQVQTATSIGVLSGCNGLLGSAGVAGSGGNAGDGVLGTSNSGNGVTAQSNNTGVDANGSIRGVYGHSSGGGTGVEGFSQSGPGLVARGATVNSNLVEGYNSAYAGRRFHITSDGTYVAGSDFAEALPARGDKTGYEPGDVLVLSTEELGTVEKASRANDTHVAGVYSTRPGVLGADKNGTSRVDSDDLPVAIIGIVPTKVSTENGSVRPGDLLTASRTRGYAMKASPLIVRGIKVYRAGTILGKALEPLKGGKDIIKVLVTLR
jgi:hypothetical protein